MPQANVHRIIQRQFGELDRIGTADALDARITLIQAALRFSDALATLEEDRDPHPAEGDFTESNCRQLCLRLLAEVDVLADRLYDLPKIGVVQ